MAWTSLLGDVGAASDELPPVGLEDQERPVVAELELPPSLVHDVVT